ncbi:unnamed protein product [Rangifer tarandus platyrhynchus]|uniref:Uncharacterized protein n=2 Tax=Rangifer tarandus platyrhynchus TaxID=3082113 RepID=A0AC59ZDX6_RANTA|nr:unnamed protein product [Rangifer tarandus platyrhynchus]
MPGKAGEPCHSQSVDLQKQGVSFKQNPIPGEELMAPGMFHSPPPTISLSPNLTLFSQGLPQRAHIWGPHPLLQAMVPLTPTSALRIHLSISGYTQSAAGVRLGEPGEQQKTGFRLFTGSSLEFL